MFAGTYGFTSYRERLLVKSSDKPPRQISIPTVRDRLLLRAVCQVLHGTIPASTGYSPHALVDRVAQELRSEEAVREFVRIDVCDFFPSIRHSLLASELRRNGIDQRTSDLSMLAVAANIGETHEPRTKGVPQGLSISGALASIYMMRFDGRQIRRFSKYFRYVDDILLIVPAGQGQRSLTTIRLALARLGLKAHPLGTDGKTEIQGTDRGIDYLGYHITRELISVRSRSFRRMFKNVLKVITDFRYRGDLERLVFRLNLKITGCIVDAKRRGWMMFFSRTENMQQLKQLDGFVLGQLRRVSVPVDARSRVKTFVKAYYEICFNLNQSTYVPNFDNFNIEQRTEVVAILLGRSLVEIEAFSVELIDSHFSRLVGQEVHDLENDVGNPS